MAWPISCNRKSVSAEVEQRIVALRSPRLLLARNLYRCAIAAVSQDTILLPRDRHELHEEKIAEDAREPDDRKQRDDGFRWWALVGWFV